MYSDSTLKSCTKDELIEFLHVAERNYRNLEDTYERSVSNANRIVCNYDKAIEEVSWIFDKATHKGSVMCPLEYLGRCSCIKHKNECPDDSNAYWAYAIKERIKEYGELNE